MSTALFHHPEDGFCLAAKRRDGAWSPWVLFLNPNRLGLPEALGFTFGGTCPAGSRHIATLTDAEAAEVADICHEDASVSDLSRWLRDSLDISVDFSRFTAPSAEAEPEDPHSTVGRTIDAILDLLEGWKQAGCQEEIQVILRAACSLHGVSD